MTTTSYIPDAALAERTRSTVGLLIVSCATSDFTLAKASLGVKSERTTPYDVSAATVV